jgi:exonuclease III
VEGDTLRAVSWNLGYAVRYKSTHERAWHYLAALDPDVAFLQEALVPQWARDKWTIVEPYDRKWSSVLIAKPELQLQATDLPEEANLDLGLSTAGGTIHLPDVQTLTVISVHAPIPEAREIDLGGRDLDSVRLPRYDKAWLRDVAYVLCRDLVQDQRFLVAGDWNTSPELWDKLHPSRHEADFFTRAQEDGWVDCYRRFQTDEGRTWFRAGNAPYQFDHAFCDELTADSLAACDIDAHPAETLQLSDHAPLHLTFSFEESS